MFNTTLRYLNLIILPHPTFDVPLSEADPVFRIHGRKGDNDTSYISQNQISQFGPIDISTPRRPVLNANERRRNTICCHSCHCLMDPFSPNEDPPLWPVDIPFNSFLSSDTSRHNPFQENGPVLSTSTRVEIATPHNLPSPSSSWLGQPRVTSFVNFSDSSDDRVTPKRTRSKRKDNGFLPSKKENRNSAPPAVSLCKGQFGLQNREAIDITSTHEPPDANQSHPTLLRKDQRQKPHANSILPYTSKHFEIGLSPIIEDTHTFANTLRSPMGVEMKPATTDTVDSSGSSYGELIQDETVGYLNTSRYGTLGGSECENQERNKQPESSVRFDTQNYPGERYWSDEFWETFEDSSLIPELTLTTPTPEIGISARFCSDDQPSDFSCGGVLGYRQPDTKFALGAANACRPNRLGCTNALASISKALGTGTDRLLGVGNDVFDDILDASVVCSSTSRLPTPPARTSGANLPSSLAAQSLRNDQTETGFLGQLLRRRSTGESKMSERRRRVWKRVCRILRSSESALDQEKSTAPATPAGPVEGNHAANGPLNAGHGWKRFSRILENTTVSSRRRSAGDLARFTESVDPLEGGPDAFSDSGNTRRHGLDIPSDSAEHVDESWHGASSPGTRAYNNEKPSATHEPTDTSKIAGTGNWYGNLFRANKAKLFRTRHKDFQGRWRYSSEGPIARSSWTAENERIRNQLERHRLSVMY